MPFMVTLRLDEDDIDRVIAALEQHAAYLKATNRDSSAFERLAEQFKRERSRR
jgi:hypothetical protein